MDNKHNHHTVSEEQLCEVAGGGRSGGGKRKMPKSKYKVGDFVNFHYSPFNCDVTGEIQNIYTKEENTLIYYTILIGCVPPGHHVFSGNCLLVSDIIERNIKGLC